MMKTVCVKWNVSCEFATLAQQINLWWLTPFFAVLIACWVAYFIAEQKGKKK